ncbi:MAG TPA: hypothetical protein VL282_09740, partial [Tepidisphaeraceae bacterium]|nr:hypothetical protein [Tepidisphaeraceae bacterium]
TLVSWQTKPQFQAVVAEIDGIYPGVHWRRSVAIVSGTVIVVDDLSSKESHHYECAWHHLGEAPMNGAALDKSFKEGEYAKLLNSRKLPNAPIRFDWKYKNVRLRLWQDSPQRKLSYIAQTGICWDNIRGMPVVGTYMRAEGRNARFVSVLDPSKSEPRVKSVRSDGDRIALDWIDGTMQTLRVRADAKGDDAISLEK